LVAKLKEKIMANKKIWLGMLVMVLVFGLTVVACEEEEEDPIPPGAAQSISGTATADSFGRVSFSFYRDHDGALSCDFTTDLSAPNNAFTLGNDEWKDISSLTPNQKVKWTATVATGLIVQTPDNPDFSVRVGTVK
jgi:hypothetical protein